MLDKIYPKWPPCSRLCPCLRSSLCKVYASLTPWLFPCVPSEDLNAFTNENMAIFAHQIHFCKVKAVERATVGSCWAWCILCDTCVTSLPCVIKPSSKYPCQTVQINLAKMIHNMKNLRRQRMTFHVMDRHHQLACFLTIVFVYKQVQGSHWSYLKTFYSRKSTLATTVALHCRGMPQTHF